MTGHLIQLNGTFNFRDIGGYVTADGHKVVCGRLYRSDALNRLDNSDLEKLCSMNIRTVVDFRMREEQISAPDRVPDTARLVTLSPKADVAAAASASATRGAAEKIQHLQKMLADQNGEKLMAKQSNIMAVQMKELVCTSSAQDAFGSFLHLLLEPGATPLVFSCQGGKDRTGWAAALVLGLLGVPYTTILDDYMLSAEYGKERNKLRMAEYQRYTDNKAVLDFLYSLMKTDETYLHAALDEVDHAGGMEQYAATSLHFSRKEQQQLKEIYLQ
jgi:protein-tyrosine phosphatase